MKDWKLMLFISFCIRCAIIGYLNLTDQQLIRLYEECLVMAEYMEDCFSQMRVNICLGELCQETKKFTEAITYFERALVMADQTNDIHGKAYAYGQLGLVYNSLGNSKQGLLYVEKCLAIASRTGMKVLEEMAYGYLGIIYHSKGEYLRAINCHQKGVAISQELNDKNSEGNAYYHLGNSYWSLDMGEEAKKWYKKCLSVISLINDKPIEEIVYERLSMIYQTSGKHDKSIRYSEKVLHLVKDNNGGREREAWVYENLGHAYKSLGKVEKAIEYYTKQLVLAETIDSKEQIKRAHFNLADVYHSMKKHFEAIKHAEKLLTISIKTGDKKAQMFAYDFLGICSLLVSDFYQAIEYSRECLNIALETNNENIEMTVYVNMGEAYHSLGKYDEAIGYLEKALNIAEEIEDIGSKGLIYGKIGMVFESLDEYDKALHYCLEALRIARETGDKKNELESHEYLAKIYSQLGKFRDSLSCSEKVLDLQTDTGLREDIPKTFANMASVYESVGKCDNVLKYFEMDLSTCQNRGDREGEGICYRNVSVVYEKQGKYQEAMDCSKKSLTIAQEIGDKKGEGSSFIRLGSVYLRQNRYNEAVDCFERSLLIANQIGSKKMELDAYSSLGNLYFDCKEYEKARDYQEKALKLAVSLGIKEAELTACRKLGCLYYLKAAIFKEQHHVNDENMCIKQCMKHLEQSLQCCEWIFDHLKDRDDCKVTIMDNFIATYKILTSVHIGTGEFDEALIVSDRGRARALSDLLESKYSEGPQYGKNVILTYAEVDSILNTCESEFCVLYFSVQFLALAIWVLAHKKPLFFVEVNVQGFAHRQLPTTECHKESEIISEVVFAAYDAMNVRDTLSCEDRSLDHLPENVQLNKSDDCFVRGERQEEVESRAPDQNKRMLQEVAPDGEKNVSEGNKSPLDSLYTDLIAPVIQNLVHEEVVIVPDGPLYMVPFAALRDPETGLFLSEMKRIRLAPSLTTLKSLQECPVDYHSKTGALIVGDPDSGTVMFQGEERTFWPLPKAQHEAKIIGKILDVAPLIRAQATKDVIMQRLHEGVAVIHIAAHGSTKGEIVLAPRTLTGERKIPEEEDYMLTMQEVQETGIKAQLVVLSCCHSGRGEIRAEGIVGISRGFLAAGARAVVASLWAIDDEATLNFMVSFYTQLKMGESASKSLQLAMNDVRGDDEEPRHWAPFFLIGDDVTINKRIEKQDHRTKVCNS